MEIAGIVVILSSLLRIPLIVFGFIYFNIKGKRTVELERIKEETLVLEIEREKLKLRMIEAEYLKCDRIIDERDAPIEQLAIREYCQMAKNAEVKTKVNSGIVEDFLNTVADEHKCNDCFEILRLMEKVT